MENDPPIQVGSIVTLRSTHIDGEMTHVGKVLRMNVWDGIGGAAISIPGKLVLEVSLQRCYNATEAERKKYFKAALQYDD